MWVGESFLSMAWYAVQQINDSDNRKNSWEVVKRQGPKRWERIADYGTGGKPKARKRALRAADEDDKVIIKDRHGSILTWLTGKGGQTADPKRT
jgi:hypothetical protein